MRSWQPQRNVTHAPESICDDIWRGLAGTLLGIRRHFISLALRGRWVPVCYCALFRPDNKQPDPNLRLHKVLPSGDMSGRISLRQWNVIVHWRAELTDSGRPINNSHFATALEIP